MTLHIFADNWHNWDSGVPAVNSIALALLQLSQGELATQHSIEQTVPFLLNLQSTQFTFDKIIALVSSLDLAALEAQAPTSVIPTPSRKRKASEISRDTPQPRSRAKEMNRSRDTPQLLSKSSGNLFNRLESFWDQLTTPNKRRRLARSDGRHVEYARLDSTPARAQSELSVSNTPVNMSFEQEERQALITFTTPQKRRDHVPRSGRKNRARGHELAHVDPESESPTRPAVEMKSFTRLWPHLKFHLWNHCT